ncbi:cob(I)yrinic acid a,c-diamide adenosyltransferase [Alkalicoccus chagannorensis]|uniref:cob(I)yrinic acid a,c-diamide adenosyltransferase n=1 Tax=Alkalicoccus chagannorensis TaxID=427072 RepID=UPI0004144906|nr:cob(I)yrinic acid a,c-diamide adenosyltransferase [Alkalicoccus chagannorensis]
MKIYTKHGDKGETQLIGRRVRKTNERVEAYGTVDELNSFLGAAVVMLEQNELYADLVAELIEIQHELFDLGGDLADVTGKRTWALAETSIHRLESSIDTYWEEAPEIKTFILPGGTSAAAQLHVCRTVARRAERLVSGIEDEHEVAPQALPYLNRLSDYFFAAARAVNARAGRSDVLYKRGGNEFK